MAEAKRNMVVLHREARGWTQTDLAENSGLSQAVISKIETGSLELSGERLMDLAKALDCPPGVLVKAETLPGIEITCLHHRRRASTMTVGVMKRIEAVTHLTRISVEGLLAGIELVPDAGLARMPIGDDQSAAVIARELRIRWGVPAGPIKNLVALIESAGIVIVVRDLGTTGQDAVSTWPQESNRPPIMLVNSGLAPDRLRFTLAHELGHLVMHTAPGEEQESEANIFAGEFLAPEQEITPELEGLTTNDFRRLLASKQKWGMSMAALIRRAHDLRQITDRQYREFYMKLGKLGWRISEPGDVAPEDPHSIGRVISLHQTSHHYDTAEIASLAGMTEASFFRHYLPDSGIPEPRTQLKLGLDHG
jgi:Zn-dependent peptidase ImmA (M78 family)/transcriptional regulator with XRE-family HTH domain